MSLGRIEATKLVGSYTGDERTLANPGMGCRKFEILMGFGIARPCFLDEVGFVLICSQLIQLSTNLNSNLNNISLTYLRSPKTSCNAHCDSSFAYTANGDDIPS